MPTINQLAPATAASDTDEFLVSQSGITRSITRALVLAGVQPQLSVASGMLVGGPNTGSGAPQQVSVGSNLTLALGTLTANASPYIVARLPSGVVPASTDSVPIGQAGTNVAVTYGQFLSGISGVAGVNGSQLLVTATGSTVQQRLADFAASTLPRTGGTLSGPLSLAADPSAALQAATKEICRHPPVSLRRYVDRSTDVSWKSIWCAPGGPEAIRRQSSCYSRPSDRGHVNRPTQSGSRSVSRITSSDEGVCRHSPISLRRYVDRSTDVGWQPIWSAPGGTEAIRRQSSSHGPTTDGRDAERYGVVAWQSFGRLAGGTEAIRRQSGSHSPSSVRGNTNWGSVVAWQPVWCLAGSTETIC